MTYSSALAILGRPFAAGVKALVRRMSARHIASMLVGGFSSVLLAGACGQRPDGSPNERPPVETKDDDGDIGGDPGGSGIGSDPGGSIGSDPGGGSIGSDPGGSSDPPWSWLPPSGPPSDGSSAGDPDPDDGSTPGGEATGGYLPVPFPSPGIEPLPPCEQKCQKEYEDDAIVCGRMQNEQEFRACQDKAYARYKSCRDNCQKKDDEDCQEKYVACRQYGPRSCQKEAGGKSVCKLCLERCNAGDSPSGQCKKCLF